ncbi:MAG: rod shape-determining protein MreC [Bacilli bacterium]|nr:rod shape-determining protein MreC [Bacilli bacterium]
MKKLEKKYKIIIIVIIIILCLGLTIYDIRNNKKNLIIENIIKDSVLIMEKLVFVPINFIDDKINEFKHFNELSKKYKDLKLKGDKYDFLEAKYRETLKEVKELQQSLKLNFLTSEYISINANVINRNINYFFNTMIIDKGSNDNIKVGDAVITEGGLIGNIINTSYQNSTVKLLTNNEENKISVKIEINENYIYGLLTLYDFKKNVFIIEGISENTEIPINSFVTTTGLSNNYPSGILIGSVSNITTDNFDLARTLEVRPSANFNDINYVTVLNRRLK